ncbi:MAG: shikimate kinase [Synechococcus sp.]
MTDQSPNEPHPLRSRLGGRNLYLVGMMGSGKSSSGRPIAQRLGYGFVDTDPVIEQLAGQPIPQIFAERGEDGFRALEAQVLQAIGQRHSLVVATGGGVITQPQNWGVLHQGIVIWLNPGRDRILARLQSDTTQRPLWQTNNPVESLDALIEARTPLYQEADLHLKVGDQSPDQVAAMVLDTLPSILTPASEGPGGRQTTAG